MALAKFTRFAIRKMIANCPAELRGKKPQDLDGELMGRYSHPWSNGNYQVYAIPYKGGISYVAATEGRIV